MASILKPEKGEPHYPDGSSAMLAIIEIVFLCGAFITLAHWAAANIHFESVMPSFLTGPERQVGATFVVGAAAQIALVLTFALVSGDLRRAISNSFKFGTIPAWGAAIIAVSIHAATITFFFLNEPAQVLEFSKRNFFLSIAPAFDGWSQEVLFRGYVVYRLARGGVPIPMIFTLTALSFAAIHIGYVGNDFFIIFLADVRHGCARRFSHMVRTTGPRRLASRNRLPRSPDHSHPTLDGPWLRRSIDSRV